MRILLVPGGGSSVDGYFTAVEQLLLPHAPLIRSDPPGLDPETGRQWLKLPEHARWLARAVRLDGPEPVLVIGHSLGGLVALRLALTEPALVAALLLLDPSPPIFAALLPQPVLRAGGVARKLGRRVGTRPAGGEPRAVPLRVRMRWIVLGGFGLAADIAAGGLAAIPTLVVSAGEPGSGSIFRRTHARLTHLSPSVAHEVWDGTTHALHQEQPERVTEAALALLRRAQDRKSTPGI